MLSRREDVTKSDELPGNFFYTMVSNFSHYAYNIYDFCKEWVPANGRYSSDNERCWLYYIFHKNDGYRSPLVLNPYRDKGNIDVNNEAYLSSQRLISLFLDADMPKVGVSSFRQLYGKMAKYVSLTDPSMSKLQQKAIIEHFAYCKKDKLLEKAIILAREMAKDEETLEKNKKDLLRQLGLIQTAWIHSNEVLLDAIKGWDKDIRDRAEGVYEDAGILSDDSDFATLLGEVERLSFGKDTDEDEIERKQLIEGFATFAPDIRLVSDEAFLLEASTSVQMLIAALRLLIDKNHTDGISEKYLMHHYLRDALGKTDTSVQSIALQKAEDVLPEAFTAHRDELMQLPLYLLAERLWRIFSLSSIKNEDIYVLTFFDELQNHLRKAGAPDIQTFLTAWDEKLRYRSVPDSVAAGVRILTIHKSKGLAFHTVLLPFSHWEIEKDRLGDMLWCETNIAPYNELGALPISTYSKAVRTSVFAPIYDEEHLERRVDALNTLYVAFTRAQCNLYVWGQTKANTAGELIYKTLKNDSNDMDEVCFEYEVGQPLIKAKEESKEDKETNRLRIEHRMEDAIDVKVVTRNPMLYFLQSNQAQDYLQRMTTDDGQETMVTKLSQREIGKRMHEVLSRIEDVGQIEETLDAARQEGIIGEDENWEAITKRINEGFRNSLVASWFSKENTVYNECAIASINEKDGLPCVLRPDRVVMKDNSITVIDYKFGHPSRLYYDQVKAYMKLLQQMYPKHDVQGYLWYIMGKGPVPVKD